MGKIAFVFAGQGSQTVGMGKELYENIESTRKVYDMAGKRIKELSFEGTTEELNATINTQPCLFAVDLACARALNEKGVFADGVAGFSLGEIPALAYAGIMSENDAYRLVCIRAEAMQRCSDENKGAMFAVLKLPTEKIENICAKLDNVYPVNYNFEGQIVVACAIEAAEQLQKSIAESSGKAIRLPVSGAFHSPLMNKASEELEKFLQDKELGEMQIPIYSNVTAKVYDNAKEHISKQVINPVLWQKTVENMIADGFDTFIEVGAGKTLSGFIKKISCDVSVHNVCDLASLENTVAEVKNA